VINENVERKSDGTIPTRPVVFVATHKHSDGTPVNEETRRIVVSNI
jgi:hypothetical protein